MDYCAIFWTFEERLLRGMGENPSPSGEDSNRNYAAGFATTVKNGFVEPSNESNPTRFLFLAELSNDSDAISPDGSEVSRSAISPFLEIILKRSAIQIITSTYCNL